MTKDAKGKVHENKDETATRHGAWWGVAVGAAVGVIFAPTVIGAAAVGGAIGAVTGHLAKGMPRSTAKELGDFIEPGPGRAADRRRDQDPGGGPEGRDQGREAARARARRGPEGRRQDAAASRRRHVTGPMPAWSDGVRARS